MRTLTLISLLAACTPLAPEGTPNQADPVDAAIVGGTVVAGPEYNFQAAVVDFDTSLLCSSVILDDNWVLTSGGCVGDAIEDVRIGVGSPNLAAMVQLPIDDAVSMPDVGIELLHVATGNLLTFGRPAFLADSASFDALATPGTMASVTGWGPGEIDGDTVRELRRAEVPILTDTACQGFADGQPVFCAGIIGIEAPDACEDFGAPLTIDVDGEPVVVGLAWDSACGDSSRPSTYLRVPAFLDEVLDTVPDAEAISPPSMCNDAYEPNDTLETSAPGLPPEGEVGLIREDSEKDFYQYTVGAREHCNIELDVANDWDFDIAYLDADGTTIESSTSFSNPTTIDVANPDEAPLEGHIRVSYFPFDAPECTPYDLNITCESLGACVDDGAGNDSSATAEPIGPGFHDGYVANGTDWFVLTVPARTTLRVTSDDVPEQATLFLTDAPAFNDWIDSDSFGALDVEYTNVSSADIQIWVGFQSGWCVDYDLTLQLDALPDCSVDGITGNDAFADAAVIQVGIQPGLVASDITPDYFRLTVPAGRVFHALADGLNGDGDFILYDGQGTLLDDDSFSPHDLAWHNAGANDVDVVLAVLPEAGTCVGYDLHTSVEACDDADDSFEPNDSFEDASGELPMGTTAGLRLTYDNDDWYLLPEVAPGQTITVDVLFLDDEGDIDARLRDENDDLLDSSTNLSDNEQLEWTNYADVAVTPRLGTYVIGEEVCEAADYDVVVTVQ